MSLFGCGGKRVLGNKVVVLDVVVSANTDIGPRTTGLLIRLVEGALALTLGESASFPSSY